MRADLYVKSVLSKCNALKNVGLWMPEPKIRPNAWLHNFEESERAVAAVLLDHFIFVTGVSVDRMLVSGYRILRDILVSNHGRSIAEHLLERAVYTSVEGEDPNVTDSGKLFCRKLRQILCIPDDRFFEPAKALQLAAQGYPVIFVDDFVGSGDQFVGTWCRNYGTLIAPNSFATVHAKTPFPAFYLTLIASSKGMQNICRSAPQPLVVATHVLNDEYSIRSLPQSRLVPDLTDLPLHIENLLNKYNADLRVPNYLSAVEKRKYGYHELGFLIAFDHSTPDASVPLLWAEGPGSWTPLVMRS